MEINKRPLRLSEIISKGFDILVKNIVDVLIIGAIFILPVAIFKALTSGVGISVDMTYILDNEIPKISYTWYGILISFLNYALNFLLGIYGTSSVVKLLYDRYKGKDISFRESIAYSFDRKGKIFLVNLVLTLICIGIIIVTVLVGILLTLTLSIIGAFIFIISILLYMVFIFTVLPMYISVLVIKDCNTSDVYKLTNSLFKGAALKRNIIRVFGLGIIYCIINLITGRIGDIPYVGSIILTFLSFIVGSFIYSCNNLIVEEELPEFNFNDNDMNDFNPNKNNDYGEW